MTTYTHTHTHTHARTHTHTLHTHTQYTHGTHTPYTHTRHTRTEYTRTRTRVHSTHMVHAHARTRAHTHTHTHTHGTRHPPCASEVGRLAGDHNARLPSRALTHLLMQESRAQGPLRICSCRRAELRGPWESSAPSPLSSPSSRLSPRPESQPRPPTPESFLSARHGGQPGFPKATALSWAHS